VLKPTDAGAATEEVVVHVYTPMNVVGPLVAVTVRGSVDAPVSCQWLNVQLPKLSSSISYFVPAVTCVNVVGVYPWAMSEPALVRRAA
jgi:hypothetical protein